MEKKKEKPLWVKKSMKEIEELIVNLAEKGLSTSKIGIVLRDNYGIPSTKVLGKKISKILADKKVHAENDLDALVKKAKQLKKHLEKNKQDKLAKKGHIKAKAKVLKLSNYYKRKGLLSKDWSYK